ncbi:unnamed protein product [Arctogadus glacialis]
MLGSSKTPAASRNEQKTAVEKSNDPLRKLGVQDNEDVRVMLGGSSMVKVRSSRWQKSRTLRLLEDGVTVWCETAKSSRRAKAQQTFAVTEVECVREGCQSEALQSLAGSVPDTNCFTVVFRGPRKSLDLLCPCEGEAQSWVRGLRTLKERPLVRAEGQVNVAIISPMSTNTNTGEITHIIIMAMMMTHPNTS